MNNNSLKQFYTNTIKESITEYMAQSKDLTNENRKKFKALKMFYFIDCDKNKKQFSINKSDLFVTNYFSYIEKNSVIKGKIRESNLRLLDQTCIEEQKTSTLYDHFIVNRQNKLGKFRDQCLIMNKELQDKSLNPIFQYLTTIQLKSKQSKKLGVFCQFFCEKCKIYQCILHKAKQIIIHKPHLVNLNQHHENLKQKLKRIKVSSGCKCQYTKDNICILQIKNRLEDNLYNINLLIQSTVALMKKDHRLGNIIYELSQIEEIIDHNMNYCLLQKFLNKHSCYQLFIMIQLNLNHNITQILQIIKCNASMQQQAPLNQAFPLFNEIIEIQEQIYPSFYVSKSKICDGAGLFAGRNIKKKEIFLQYIGELIDVKNQKKQLQKRDLFYNKHQEFYTFSLQQPKIIIDSFFYGNLSRFINHLPQKQSNAEWIMKNELKKVQIKAKVDIARGQQIFIDYGKQFYANWKKQFDTKIKEMRTKQK